MPQKKSDATPGMKLLHLYYLMLFTGRRYTLNELSKKLDCSKQTVLRLVDQLTLSGLVDMEVGTENRQSWYQVRAPRQRPSVSLSAGDIRNLVLCRDMVEHLLPESLRREIGRAVTMTTTLLQDNDQRPSACISVAGTRTKGAIDYSRATSILDAVRQAMVEGRVCKVLYCSAARPQGREYHVAPLRLLAYHESLSILCWRVTESGPVEKRFNTNLYVHRISEISLTDRKFEAGEDDLPGPKGTFGYMDGDPFRVKVFFQPEVAAYVSERIWSDDQVIEDKDRGGLTLTFSATSKPEVLSWIMSFGPSARLMEPAELVERLKSRIAETAGQY